MSPPSLGGYASLNHLIIMMQFTHYYNKIVLSNISCRKSSSERKLNQCGSSLLSSFDCHPYRHHVTATRPVRLNLSAMIQYFFSHDKSVNSTFSHDFSAKRTDSKRPLI